MDVNKLEKEVKQLRKTLQIKENELKELKLKLSATSNEHSSYDISLKTQIGEKLPKWAIERYSRQILLPDIGVSGQEKIMKGRVLIVGAGGLGCPAAVYLAGAGVGEIGVVDYDAVDITNIHRQILHAEKMQGVSKAESAASSLRSMNSSVDVREYRVQLDARNALQIAARYDVLLDCSDNAPTRYLLNDVAVAAQESPFVGPCYRCVFPTPPPPAAVGSCSADGVAGPVPGTIGCLQALEAIKLLVGHSRDKLLVQRLLVFDGEDTSFRTVKLRPRNPNCPSCSESASIKELVDYEAFCNMQANEKELDVHILPAEHRVSAAELSEQVKACDQRHLLVDVRNEAEYRMCCIEGARNYPIEKLDDQLDGLLEEIRASCRVTFICRRGNDSQVAAKRALDLIESEHRLKIQDLTGGLHAWSIYVDNEFPVY